MMWIPLAFVLLFSTGFICARLGTMDAEPFTLLLVRSLLVLPVLGIILWARRAPNQWGSRAQRGCQMGVGMLLHGAYLGGVFAAVKAGLPAGLTALLVSLHPLATAALSLPLLGVRLGPKQWCGLALGAMGASLVLSGGLEASHGWPLVGLAWCLVALVGISSATLWQKRLSGGMGMVEGLIFQYLGAALVFSVAATWVGSFTFDPTPRLLLTLAWLVGAISVGAIWLLMIMIARGEAHQVARTFFLVPPCAAVMAWLMFDEQWTLPMIIGAALVVAGLALDRPAANQTKATRGNAVKPSANQGKSTHPEQTTK